MVTFESQAAAILIYSGLAIAGLALLAFGFIAGKVLSASAHRRDIAQARNDLFTSQQGFKKLYESEIETLKQENALFKEHAEVQSKRVEDYRKKAAGFGGLFSSGGKKADAMYALLLENEALEEALHKQHTKLNAERSDAVQESLRNIGYRRVLMSQLLNDNRIKEYVREILEDDRRLPHIDAANGTPKLPPTDSQ